ncbi:MAG: hypothetical protein WED33_04925 [Bacteroidia bacterium]
MKSLVNTIIPVICLVALTANLYAQPGKNNDVLVIGDFNPKLIDAEKMFETPELSDTIQSRFPISYELQSRKVSTAFEVDPIEAAKVKGEPLDKIYNGYVRGGFGSYLTPFGELFYSSGRNKHSSTGVRLKHLSSSGQIADVGYSGFSNNEVSVFGKSIKKKFVFGGGLDYRRDVVHYYGFDSNPIDTSLWLYGLERDVTRQRYQLIDVNASLVDNFPVDTHATKYKVDLRYHNYSDAFDAQENRFNAKGDVSFFYRLYSFNIKAALDVYKNQNAVWDDNFTLFNLRPQILFKQNNWRLRAALNMFASSDTSNGFRLAPEIDFDLHLFEDILILNVGTDSRLNRFSYRTLTEQNPWLISDILPLNTWNPFRLYGGLRGAFSSFLAFNVNVSYTPSIENQFFFVNDTSEGNWNKLNYVRDNASLFEVHGEITWQNHEKLRIIAKADYIGYSPDKELKAWYVPSLRLSLGAKYNLQEKISLDLAILTFNRQFYRDFITDDITGIETAVARELKGIADVNLGAEYRYTKRLSMFVKLNNMLNVRYKRFSNYPTQRFMALGGISYMF